MLADSRRAGRTWPETVVKSHPQDSSSVCFLLFLHIYFLIFFGGGANFRSWLGTKEVTLVPSM